VTFHLLIKWWFNITLVLSGGICIKNQDNIPTNRNDSDGQGHCDGVYYGGVDYHDLVSSLLHNPIDDGSSDPTGDDPTDAPPSETDDFREEVKKLHSPLYAGCKNYFRLSFIIELYLIKSRGKMSNITFGETVHLVKNAFPDINILDSFFKTKKFIRALGV